ncbi:hypothetical protein D3227_33300 [Mesorhizobium waimense]|uniref:Uncharacterized protein n=1 Tax=Mesorhizobium waimense TaxID=1300307 RepID=A0A3A5K0Q7_9HYPH|nr:hypothetical protein [Mesorhizobium waimense]RJT28885.1 hypothetical protein D3227_33300 [Mesorhizobium waimense]
MAQTAATDAEVLEQIRSMLAGGLKTEVFPRGDTHEEIAQIIARLRESDGSLESKLVIGGFTLETIEHGGIEQPCETCMYYLVHRKFCELPEFAVPVEPEWSCRLWRI